MYFVVDLIWTEIIEHEQSERFPHLNTVSTVKKKLIILKLFDLKHESWNKDVGFIKLLRFSQRWSIEVEGKDREELSSELYGS